MTRARKKHLYGRTPAPVDVSSVDAQQSANSAQKRKSKREGLLRRFKRRFWPAIDVGKQLWKVATFRADILALAHPERRYWAFGVIAFAASFAKWTFVTQSPIHAAMNKAGWFLVLVALFAFVVNHMANFFLVLTRGRNVRVRRGSSLRPRRSLPLIQAAWAACATVDLGVLLLWALGIVSHLDSETAGFSVFVIQVAWISSAAWRFSTVKPTFQLLAQLRPDHARSVLFEFGRNGIFDLWRETPPGVSFRRNRTKK